VQPLLNAYDIPARKTAADVNQALLDWLPASTDRPFFAFLNYFDAHEPFLPPPPFDSRFGSPAGRKNFLIKHLRERRALREGKEQMSPAEVQAELDAYEGTIAYIDHQVDILLDQLERRGTLANTLVIITSDHGEQMGEQGKFGHGSILNMPVIHVPLMIVLPERTPAGRAVSDVVSLKDLPATVLDLLNIPRHGVPGDSLARYWQYRGSAPPSETHGVITEHTVYKERHAASMSGGFMRSVVHDRYHYILNHDGSEELYDFRQDPAEARNLAASADGRSVIELFRVRLAAIARNESRPVPPGLVR
jgi:arylsulfatase A-like enzyme